MSRYRLDKCDGPECPYCGCADTESKAFASRWGQSLVKWVCRACGGTFNYTPAAPGPSSEPAEPTKQKHHIIDMDRPAPIIYSVIRCPVDQGGCGSSNTKIYRTKRPIRYHKCADCGTTFKSVEGAE